MQTEDARTDNNEGLHWLIGIHPNPGGFEGLKTSQLFVKSNPSTAFSVKRIAGWYNLSVETINTAIRQNRIMSDTEQKLYPAVTALTVINILIFFIGALFPGLGRRIYEAGVLDVNALFARGEWYRLFTSIFLHSGMGHLVSNMLVLFFAGAEVEKKSSTLSFIIMYILTGLGGNLLSVLMSVRQQEMHVSLGASGAVFGMLGVLAVFTFADRKDLQKGALMRLFAGIGISLYSGSVTPGVDQMAHVGGFVSGILYGALLLLAGRMSRITRPKTGG